MAQRKVAGSGLYRRQFVLFQFAPSFAYLLLLFAAQMGAQTLQQSAQQTDEISYEGQAVSSVEIAGQPDIDQAKALPVVVQKAGTPYSDDQVRASIEALKREANATDVQVEVTPEASGLRVMFVLQPAFYVGVLKFPGATKVFSYTRLLQVANYPDQEPYSAHLVDQGQTALATFFQRTGYFLATVKAELQTDREHGIINIIYHTELGRHAKFGDVVLTGATPEETARLHKSLTSLRARLHNAYLKPGKSYSLHQLQNAVQFMENELGKQDYLDAQVKLIAADYNPNTNRANIRIQVTQGAKVAVKVEGAHVWGRTQKKLIPLYQENSTDNDLVQEGATNLKSHFQNQGYYDANVQPNIDRQNANTNIVYKVEKGPRYHVTSVTVDGNEQYSDKELLEHVVIKKGHFIVLHGDFSQQLLRTSVKNLESVYHAAGYSTVKVTPSVRKSEKTIDVNFHIDEGQPDIVDSFTIEGNDTVSEAKFALKGLKLSPGKPYSSKLLDDDRNAITAAYLNLGYLIMTFRSTAKAVSGDPHRVQVVYSIHEGPQVNTAAKVILGDEHARPTIIDHSVQIKTGKPMAEAQMLTAESRLYSMGIFDWASITPTRPITSQTQEDVLVKLHESARNAVTYGFGFEVINRGGSVPSGTVALPGLPPVGLPSNFKTSERTFWGPRGTFEYTRRDLFGMAQSLTVGILAGRLDQKGSFTYSDPYFLHSSYSSAFTSSIEYNSENPIFSATLADAGYQVQKYLDAKRTKLVIFRYNFQHTTLNNLLIPALVSEPDRNVRLSTFSASFIRDTRDKALDAHRGIYDSFEWGITPSALGSSTDFTRFLGQTAYYRSFGKIVWANSLRLGLEVPFNGGHIPLSEEFFSGGGSTLRGFPLNGAGPQSIIPACGNPADPTTCAQITVPLGGPQLVILNTELRFPLGLIPNLGGVVFYDGGNAYDRVGFHNFFDQYSNSIGAGFRYATPVGPIRIDIGHNLNAPPGLKSTQIFITLGQAF